jgi:hypothetical protein
MSPCQQVFVLRILIVGFTGCAQLDGLDEENRNTYEGRGTIYKGYSDQPLANQKVYLEVGYIGVGKEEITRDKKRNFTTAFLKVAYEPFNSNLKTT